MTVFTSLIVALLFAAIFLFGGRVAYRPGQRGYRRFLSFAAGIAVWMIDTKSLNASSTSCLPSYGCNT